MRQARQKGAHSSVRKQRMASSGQLARRERVGEFCRVQHMSAAARSRRRLPYVARNRAGIVW